MNIGMLWFDNDPKAAIGTKIEQAATYYQTKYGQLPNLCFVHPSMVSGETAVNHIQVRTSKSVRPNHFWLGVDKE